MLRGRPCRIMYRENRENLTGTYKCVCVPIDSIYQTAHSIDAYFHCIPRTAGPTYYPGDTINNDRYEVAPQHQYPYFTEYNARNPISGNHPFSCEVPKEHKIPTAQEERRLEDRRKSFLNFYAELKNSVLELKEKCLGFAKLLDQVQNAEEEDESVKYVTFLLGLVGTTVSLFNPTTGGTLLRCSEKMALTNSKNIKKKAAQNVSLVEDAAQELESIAIKLENIIKKFLRNTNREDVIPTVKEIYSFVRNREGFIQRAKLESGENLRKCAKKLQDWLNCLEDVQFPSEECREQGGEWY